MGIFRELFQRDIDHAKRIVTRTAQVTQTSLTGVNPDGTPHYYPGAHPDEGCYLPSVEQAEKEETYRQYTVKHRSKSE